VTPVRLRLAVALAVVLVAAPAVAVAARLTGTNRPDRLVGTAQADTIDGRAGNDTISGLGGSDLLIGGLGLDRLTGGPGNDSMAANGDSGRDTVSCSPGADVVNADLGDSVARDCELISRQLSTDTTSNSAAQHATEVEPDSFAYGSTMVAAFQVGRIGTGGAAAIGVATSSDGARHWRSGLLPGVTASSPQPGTDPRASDPTVGFDAAHGVWLVASLGIATDHFELLVSRSPDGISWGAPVSARRGSPGSLDKEWIACDNWPSSPSRGRCYLSYLEVSSGLIVTQTSIDGGLTWAPAVTTSTTAPRGQEPNGAQPLPRPDGSLTVVYAIGAGEDEDSGGEGLAATFEGDVLATTSTDGGASFSPSVRVADLTAAPVSDLRAPPLPSADVAADGRLFVAWQDCRLSPSCARNRIVLSTSADGATWSPPAPLPPSPAAATQFVPGLAADPTRTGRAQRLALVYYSLATTCASGTPCPRIDVWLATSANGGAGWGASKRLDAEPMQLGWLPRAGGRFLGDYLSTSFVAGGPIPVFALAVAPWGGKLREAIMALQPR
jgi:RTX calcium-binding nonapeptide repeat (4 copies)